MPTPEGWISQRSAGENLGANRAALRPKPREVRTALAKIGPEELITQCETAEGPERRGPGLPGL